MLANLPLADMTVTEKLQIIEDVWLDLAKEPDQVPSPDWHGDVLRAREQGIRDGQARFLDIAEAKQILGHLLK